MWPASLAVMGHRRPLHRSSQTPASLPVSCSPLRRLGLASGLALAHWVGTAFSKPSTCAHRRLSQPRCLAWPSTEPPARGEAYRRLGQPNSGRGLVCKVRTHLACGMGPRLPQTPSPWALPLPACLVPSCHLITALPAHLAVPMETSWWDSLRSQVHFKKVNLS